MSPWYGNVFFSLAVCEGNPPFTCKSIAHKGPVMQSFPICNLLAWKMSCWWFETPWRSCDVTLMTNHHHSCIKLVVGSEWMIPRFQLNCHNMQTKFEAWDKWVNIHAYRIHMWWMSHIEGILPKGPYLPCVSMAGRALLAGYPRYECTL